MKTFETFNRDSADKEPQIGDYVLVKIFPNLIGKVDTIDGTTILKKYIIEYDEPIYHTPSIVKHYVAFKREILYFSKSKEELEIQIETNKYNI